ncbi:MAG: hypothetical protein SPJ31_03035, partial [Oscillospiraceae bacterium]|nr:hypothetical protein [Oscillospiraceae bacterium]
VHENTPSFLHAYYKPNDTAGQVPQYRILVEVLLLNAITIILLFSTITELSLIFTVTEQEIASCRKP